MFHSVKELLACGVTACDDDVGMVHDVYLDDRQWQLRHFVIDAGDWLMQREVVVPAQVIAAVGWDEAEVQINLTREEIAASPSAEVIRPASRQQQEGAPVIEEAAEDAAWHESYLGALGFPGVIESVAGEDPAVHEAHQLNQQARLAEEQTLAGDNPHLHSFKAITGYAVKTIDDRIGHVVDVLFDEVDWSVQSLVIDPVNWWPGKHVLIEPRRVQQINCSDQQLVVDMTREEVEHSPVFDAKHPPRGAHELQHLQHPQAPSRIW